jgi:hypothetical protein
MSRRSVRKRNWNVTSSRAVAVVVDRDLVERVRIHREVVRPAVRILERQVVRDEGDVVFATRLVAPEHVEVRPVEPSGLRDERSLAVAGGDAAVEAKRVRGEEVRVHRSGSFGSGAAGPTPTTRPRGRMQRLVARAQFPDRSGSSQTTSPGIRPRPGPTRRARSPGSRRGRSRPRVAPDADGAVLVRAPEHASAAERTAPPTPRRVTRSRTTRPDRIRGRARRAARLRRARVLEEVRERTLLAEVPGRVHGEGDVLAPLEGHRDDARVGR